MARIKFGMMMTDARGKLGGQVFTKTRSGAIVRTKVIPVNPKTNFQGSVRNAFAGVSRSWSNLSEEARRGWNGAVDGYQKTNIFGDLYLPSGKSLFQQINTNLLNIGKLTVSTVPVSKDVMLFSFDSVEVDISETSVNLGVTLPAIVPLTSYLVLEATAPNSPGRYNFSGQYRKISVVLASAGFEGADVYSAYVAKFGAPKAGVKISFRIYSVDSVSGLASPRATQDAIVQP